MKKIGLYFLPIIIFFTPALSLAQSDAAATSELGTIIRQSQTGNKSSRTALSALIYSKKILNYPKTPDQEKEAALLLDYLTPLAEKGDLQAQVDLGLVYMLGNIVPEDPEAALEWLNTALNNKNISKNKNLAARAQSFLAYFYLTGEGVKRDREKALQLLKAAEKYRDRDALFGLGVFYIHKSRYDYNNEREHFKTAFDYFEKAAASGHPSAYYEMSIMYQNGRGVKQDNSLAMSLLEKSVEMGSARGREWLAYQHSLRGRKEESIRAYRILAETGLRNAMLKLGSDYAYGAGVPQDDAESFKWFSKASEQYGYMSDYWLGLAYYNGKGAPQDKDQAFGLFLGDAYRGNTLAMKYVGKMYIDEEGSVKKDVSLGCAFTYSYHNSKIKELKDDISHYKHYKKELKKYYDPVFYKELWSCYEYTDKHQNLDEITQMMEEIQVKIKQTNRQKSYREKMWYQSY